MVHELPSAIFISIQLILIIVSPLLSDKIKGYGELWFLGDNFVASTYRTNFKKIKDYDFFTKQHLKHLYAATVNSIPMIGICIVSYVTC